MPDDYAELHCLSNFSFLRGASYPEELVERAYELGYTALAITDECSVSGVVRAHGCVRRLQDGQQPGQRGRPVPKLIIGSEFTLDEDLKLVVLAMDRCGYGQLCELITVGRRSARRGAVARSTPAP